MPSTQVESALTNGHDDPSHAAGLSGKKAGSVKGKKAASKTNDEATRLLQARISQLEQDAAGEKDQELEIEREVKRANRDLMQQVSKLDNMQKIDYLTKRSSELLADMRRLEKENQKNKRRGDTLQKERDNSRSELSKTNGLKEKLEKLCRELQRDNNKMKNENKELQTVQKRNSVAWDEKYSNVLMKLEGIQEDKDTPKKQVVDMSMDELFKSRFKSFIDQYELRELHFHSLMRTKELEVQYHMARYEREKKTADGETSKSRQLQGQVQAFTKTETELRNQLNVYVDKFKQVEDTLNNSNDLFLSFRKEMEDMSKKGKRLEKENEGLKRQKEATSANILRMAEERQEWKNRIEAANKKSQKLMDIVQAMQQQGRAVPPNMANTLNSCLAPDTQPNSNTRQVLEDSDYSGEGDGQGSEPDDEEDEDEDDEDDEDTEEEAPPAPPVEKRTSSNTSVPYGPERPPPRPQQQQQQPQQSVNGH